MSKRTKEQSPTPDPCSSIEETTTDADIMVATSSVSSEHEKTDNEMGQNRGPSRPEAKSSSLVDEEPASSTKPTVFLPNCRLTSTPPSLSWCCTFETLIEEIKKNAAELERAASTDWRAPGLPGSRGVVIAQSELEKSIQAALGALRAFDFGGELLVMETGSDDKGGLGGNSGGVFGGKVGLVFVCSESFFMCNKRRFLCSVFDGVLYAVRDGEDLNRVQEKSSRTSPRLNQFLLCVCCPGVADES